MTPDAAGDRFVLESDARWLDLATGRHAYVMVEELPVTWRGRAQALAEELESPAAGHRLIDFGRTGASAWFEARTSDAAVPVTTHGRNVLSQLARIVIDGATRRHSCQIQYLNLHPPRAVGAEAVASAIAREMRHVGIVCVRAGVALDARIVSRLLHRHLALLACDGRDRAAVFAWTSRLERRSHRTHLVVDCSPQPAKFPGVRVGAPLTLESRSHGHSRHIAVGVRARARM